MKVAFIVDTSALVAIVKGEPGSPALETALLGGVAGLPAPALVEFERVVGLAGNRPDPRARAMLDALGIEILPFTAAAADAAVVASEDFGSGSGRGGPLNLLDLMVYAVAKVDSLAILCTGKDFAATDAVLHPASRRY